MENKKVLLIKGITFYIQIKFVLYCVQKEYLLLLINNLKNNV